MAGGRYEPYYQRSVGLLLTSRLPVALHLGAACFQEFADHCLTQGILKNKSAGGERVLDLVVVNGPSLVNRTEILPGISIEEINSTLQYVKENTDTDSVKTTGALESRS